jgi:hypothetical protein
LDARILMKMKGYPRSNLGRRSTNGRPGARPLGSVWPKQSAMGTMATGFRELKFALHVTKL